MAASTSSITSTGIGTGLNITDLVQKLVDAEGQPALAQLQRRETLTNSRLSAIGSLKSALSAFQTAARAIKDSDTFLTRKATSSSDSIVNASASTKAVPGSYTVVVDHLATNHQLVSGGTGFAGATANVGTGSLTFQVGSDPANSFTVAIDAAHQSLASLRDVVNAATDNKGVAASIINVDDGSGGTVSRLVFTAKNTGTASAISVSVLDDDGNNTDTNGLSQLAYGAGTDNMTQQTAAVDALVKINGFDVTRSSNTISDAVDGLTLDLKSAAPTTPVTVTVALDNDAITKSVTDFITAYNNLGSVVKNLDSYDSTTKKAGVLFGDSLLRGMKSQIRSALSSPVAGASAQYSTLQMIGIEIDRYGVMSLKEDRFKAALAADPASVSAVFNSTDGVAKRVDSRLDTYLLTGGLLESRTNQLNATLKRITDETDKENDHLATLQIRLLKQFNAMDSLVAGINATGTFLTQQLNNLAASQKK